MKKSSILALTFAAIGAVACSDGNVKYNVSGTGAPEDGKTVYLIDQLSSANIDSTVVSGGAFQLQGKGLWFVLTDKFLDYIEEHMTQIQEEMPV